MQRNHFRIRHVHGSVCDISPEWKESLGEVELGSAAKPR